MELIIDNQIVKVLIHHPSSIVKHPLLVDSRNRINFRWPSLLEYLGLGSLLLSLSTFDQTHPLFVACISTLHANEEKEVFFHVYDHLFVENLNQIKALPQINPPFLLQAIKEQRQKTEMFAPTLAAYEMALEENPSQTMHDLILYLAWDRMCIWMARLFDYQSTNPKFIKGIAIVKECLIESYQHIAQQGKTSPGIYRMLESLVFYQMREENLQKHTDSEWRMLSQSFELFKSQEELPDFFYIDDAVTFVEREDSTCYLTLDSPDRVNSRLILAQYMIDKLKMEIPGWSYALRPSKLVYLSNY